MSALDRLPPWATTGVGSLPFTDAEAAAAHAVAAYDLPFCPQLPRLEGDMITEWLGADPARCGWSPARDRERPRAWDAFLRRLKLQPPEHRVVKLQATGPVTLACALERRDALDLASELAVWLAANVADQVRTLAELDLDVLLMVDEPSLHEFAADGVERVWDPLRACAPCWGLHLCGPVPWETVRRAAPEVLSFDVSLGAIDPRLLAGGTRVAWGIVQPHRAEHAADARERLKEALADIDLSGYRSLLTPSCGSGRVSCERELELVAALRDAVPH
ncbi:hypothetical protein [Solirubrobacter soli]|uniref:hypothetical protein n=1 Tax=Solirubrobacter soli TaxID=363832 RepID=UPI00040A2583|nr:hypothetical protein [Solirubrobacter soli]